MIASYRSLPAAAVAVLLALPGLAQEPAPAATAVPYGPPQPTTRMVFDQIVAIVGDRVVLSSTIERELEANTQGQRIPPDQKERQRGMILRKIIEDEVWVQQGKVLGKESPDVFEEFVNRSVDDRMDEMVEDYGSVTRAIEELQAIGTSWGATRDDYRKELLSQIAQQQLLGQRFGANWSLMVTPEEMQRYYEDHAAEFGAKRRISVSRVFFSLRGKDRAEVMAKATQAAAAWRREPVDAGSIAERFDGKALKPLTDVRPEDPKDANQPFLKSFAAAGKAGDVSDPIEHGPLLWVLRLTQKVDRAALVFTDQDVQDQIRNQLANQRFIEFRQRLTQDKIRNLVYMPDY